MIPAFLLSFDGRVEVSNKRKPGAHNVCELLSLRPRMPFLVRLDKNSIINVKLQVLTLRPNLNTRHHVQKHLTPSTTHSKLRPFIIRPSPVGARNVPAPGSTSNPSCLAINSRACLDPDRIMVLGVSLDQGCVNGMVDAQDDRADVTSRIEVAREFA